MQVLILAKRYIGTSLSQGCGKDSDTPLSRCHWMDNKKDWSPTSINSESWGKECGHLQSFNVQPDVPSQRSLNQSITWMVEAEKWICRSFDYTKRMVVWRTLQDQACYCRTEKFKVQEKCSNHCHLAIDSFRERIWINLLGQMDSDNLSNHH